jgi:2-dehydropantoate 2-reductase
VVNRRAKEVHLPKSVGGRPYPGGSTPQGLARGAATSEVDFLNGEVVLLGRKHGVRTPVNAALQALMRDMVRTGARPGCLSAEELRQRITNAL